MRKNYRFILSLAAIIGSCLFASPAYPGASNGVWEQIHVAVFSESSGDVGTQIGADDEAYTVEPGSKLFVVIQANFTTRSRDQDIEISWRTWGGSWAVASPKGTGSDTDWEFWDSNYNSLDSATIHFTGSNGAVYLEDDSTDAGDPDGLEEFWFVVEAPTANARYELAISEDGIVEGSQGTISQQIDITVAFPLTLADHAEGQEPDRLEADSAVTGEEFCAFQLSNSTGSTATLTGLVFQLSAVNGLVQGDFDNFYIYVDADGSGDIEGGETTKVCAAEATTAISGATGTITFSGCSYDIADSDTIKMVLTGDLAHLAPGDSFTIDLGPDDLTPTGDGSDCTTTTHVVDGATGYQYRKKITIDKDELGATCATDQENLTDFPLLVTLTGSDFAEVAAVTGYEGYDLIFKDADGNQLNHEIEEYDETTNNRLVAWVRVPTIYYDRDTVIWMYYGNPSVTAATENPEGVWDANFKGVWHLNEATGETVLDSTQYSNDGSPMNSPAAATTSKFAGALDFDGINQAVSVGTCGITENFTVEGWVYPQNLDGTTIDTYFRLAGSAYLRHDGINGLGQAHFFIVTDGTNRHLRVNGQLSDNTWIHLVGTWDGTNQIIYINGQLADSQQPGGALNDPTAGTIGVPTGSPPDAIMDEVRYSDDARSSCWIGTEYNNQKASSILVSVAAEESWTFAHYKTITIDKDYVGSSCSQDLTDFPVMIRITGDDFADIANDVDADGYDIIFKDANGNQLAHEIEKYDETADNELIAWVKVPRLSRTSDTVLTIHYGNDDISTPTENPAGVWDANFKGVYHLNEDVDDEATGSAVHVDSTGTNVNATQNGNVEGAGRIADGQLFDNVGDYIVATGLYDDIDATKGTVSAWIELNTTSDAGTVFAARVNDENRFYMRWSDSGSEFSFVYVAGVTTSQVDVAAGATIDEGDGKKHLVTLTWDTTADEMKAFIDGAQVGTTQTGMGTLSGTIRDTVAFGANATATHALEFDGMIDEVRISDTARDACWIETEYANQNAPTTFYSISSELGVVAATAVDLVTFMATGEGSAVKVSWETAGEIDNKGFHLYRSTRYEGPFERLTDKLIPGAGFMTQTRAYSFMDADVTRGQLYYYQLEDIDIHGQRTLHGPVCVDWDGDGIPDDWERAFGLNPGVDDAGLDPDNDGLTNYQEYLHGSDPRDADSDGDGIVDGEEAWRLEGLEADGSRMLGRGVDVLSEDADGLVLELHTPGFEAESVAAGGRTFQRLRIDDYIHGYTNEIGRPQLPVKGILLDVPPGKAAKIRVLETEVQHHNGYLVYPVPEQSDDTQREADGPAEVFAIDEAFYLQDTAYPAMTAGTGRRYVFRGQAKHQILFYPLAFNPAFGELTFYSRIRLKVDYVDAALIQDDGPQPVAWRAPVKDPGLTADGVLASLNLAALAAPALTAPLTPVLSSARMLLGALWRPFDAADPDAPAYKILTSAEGIYRLMAADLSAAGIDTKAMDLSRIRLYYQGAEAALYIHDADGDNTLEGSDYILFYGRDPEDAYAKYTTSAVYWLALNGGEGMPKRMAAIDGTPAGAPAATEFETVVRHEVDALYGRTAPGSDGLDRWFFATYIPGDGWDRGWVPNAGDLIPFTVALPGAIGTGTLTINLFDSFDQEHAITVAVNGTGYGTFTWNRVEYKRITIDNVPLRDGDNTVSLACSSGEDTVLLDWIEVDYVRNFTAVGSQLKFSHADGHRYTVSNLTGSDLMIFDISDAADVVRMTGAAVAGSGPYTLEFEPQTRAVNTSTYLVLTEPALKTPDEIVADAAGNLGDTANGADYILITHRDIGWDGSGDAYPWLDDLVSLRRAQGLRVKVVDVADIYDEFSYGHTTPQALRDFLIYAYGRWTPPAPRYVLLVGDHTYDYKNISGGGAENFVPTWLTFTDYMGETVTDEYFARISGDDAVPDLYIGRLPAESAAEAAVMVQKIIDYEQAANTKTWQKDTLLVADDQTEDYERVFELINEDAAGMLPAAMNSPAKAYLSQYVVARDLTADIKRGFDTGSLIINYSGHGGFNLWATERIFDVSNAWPGYYHDVDDLTALTEDQKGRYPFVVSMSCLSGYFAGLGAWENPSLMEALLRAANKGAAATLMPTGETTTEGQHILNAALFEALFTEDIRRLGPAVAAAKQTLLANGGSYYDQVSATFLLFGDPAMELKVPLPRRPTALSAQLTESAAVALAWNSALNANGQPAAGYHLYRSTTPGSGYGRLSAVPLADSAYTDIDVCAGATYYYTVTAVDDDGDESVPSASVSVTLTDSDSDGLPDVLEAAGCTGSGIADSDGDGLSDGTEDANLNGMVDAGETDPCNADSDGDGLPDGWEASHGLDALNSGGSAGADGDADGDGWTNTQEYLSCTDPADSASLPSAPTAPAVNYPADAAEVETPRPQLSVNNAADADCQDLRYVFEVYADQQLTTLVAAAAATGIAEDVNTTTWQVPVQLSDNTVYYWRTRAYDGLTYSDWMPTAEFFVNTTPEAPTVPAVSAPPDGSEVTVLQPILQVLNATDADRDSLFYEFRVFADKNLSTLATAKTGVVQGTGNTTAWQVTALLADNTHYWWTARATDADGLAGAWSSPAVFFVNTANDAPGTPPGGSPADGAEVTTVTPLLTVEHAVDADLDLLSYYFEIDTAATFDSFELEQSVPLAEQAGDTTTWAPLELLDNTTYHWRVRAYDGAAYGPWRNSSFFVNTENDAPEAPAVDHPGDQSKVAVQQPTLAVKPAVDADGDALTYDFELYADSDLTQLISEADGTGLSWPVGVTLEDNRSYFWRARAVDAHGQAGSWSPRAAFFVNTANDAPTAPVLNNPVSGGTDTSLTPTLSVFNAEDPDQDALRYEFELYADADLTQLVNAAVVEQGYLITSWTVPAALADHSTYYWRVRANDGLLAGSWMPTAVLTLNTAGADTKYELACRQEIFARSRNRQIVAVPAADSSIFNTSVEIPPGALRDNCTINIGAVTNPPALRTRTRTVGRVIEFGPSGMIFSVPIVIKLPYTAAALKQARVADTSELQVFYYDTALLAWVPVDIDSIDPLNQLVSIETNHFSMYTIGAAVADHPSAGGGSGVSCFVSSAQADLLGTELPVSTILGLLALIGFLWLGNKKTKGKRAKVKGSKYGIRHTAHGARIQERRKPDDKPGAPHLL